MAVEPLAADVVIVGAGISGLATAVELAGRGLDVMVIDKEPGPAHEASSRAQGSLRIQGREAVEHPLAMLAIRQWRELAASDPAGAASGEIEFNGNAYIAERPEELPELRALVRNSHALGLDDVRVADPDRTREAIPAATGPFCGAMLSSIDGQADPQGATEVYERRARALGVRLRYDTKVLGLEQSAGRLTGVVTSAGTVTSTRAVLAAGVWTAHLASTIGIRVPIMPVALTTGETTPLPRILGPTIRSTRFSAKQRPDGRVVFDAGMSCTVAHGVTLADTQFLRLWAPRLVKFLKSARLSLDWTTTAKQLRTRRRFGPHAVRVGDVADRPNIKELNRALRAMAEVFPVAGSAHIERCWVGMVDMSPDGLPFIDSIRGVTIACGFSGHGFTLGPATGRVLADLVTGAPPEVDVSAFSLARLTRKLATPKRMM